MAFLPVSKEDMAARGWESCDVVLVTGDAYVDHPSFGAAIISRLLEAQGFRVCILAQPQRDDDYRQFGRPRLGFFVTGGNIDSMVAHYTAAKRTRSDDLYSPGGKAGFRPDRAVTVYCRAVRRLFGDIPLIIGGLEASLRRFAHYDYWDDAVRPSILIDTGADLLVYGMGETATLAVARRLAAGEAVGGILDVPGTAYAVPTHAYAPRPCAECPSFELVREPTDSGKKQYAISARIQYDEHDAARGKTVIQRHGDRIVVANPPAQPLDGAALDRVYELPYERTYHPKYEAMGGVPAIEEVRFSITHNRGCFGACNFCALAYHQGRLVTARTADSVVREAQLLAKLPDFKGYINDVGGPTANFRRPACDKQATQGFCKGKKCLAPTMCPAVHPDHTEYLELLRRVAAVPGVRKVFVRSGVRYDYIIADPDESFFRELVALHVSGQLKVAPEHCCDAVLDKMGKPRFAAYERFQKRFYELTKRAGKEQYLVPYMISSHPGSTLADAVELAVYLRRERMRPEQVQDFYPTPGTISTAMFYTGLDPYTLEKVFVPRTPDEKRKQRALLQYYKKENAPLVRAALREAGREDLIGAGKDCLVCGAPVGYNREKGAPAAKNRRGAHNDRRERKK
ncbi:MAG: YgiQ family radical SAM protein [Oscillospiraceae bacterium]|nr:YgiQ family radical SAM protein [Oscillospiraceae bacterium]